AKEKNQDKDDKNRAHNIASRQLLIAPACRRYQLLLHRVSHRVVQAADSVLNLADGPVGLAVALQLGVADRLSDGLFRGAFDFPRRTGDSVLVHEWAPCVLRRRVTALGLAPLGSAIETVGEKFERRQPRKLLTRRGRAPWRLQIE